jgi:hypothetical protein
MSNGSVEWNGLMLRGGSALKMGRRCVGEDEGRFSGIGDKASGAAVSDGWMKFGKGAAGVLACRFQKRGDYD